jgi:hypothetical protein
LIALGLIFLGVYAFIMFEVYQGLVDVTLLLAVASTGVFMLLLTVVGYVGILSLRKKFLVVYLCTLFVLSLLVLAFGLVFVSYVLGLETSATGIATIDETQANSLKKIYNYINCTYVECCSVYPGINVSRAPCQTADLPNQKVDNLVCENFAKFKFNTPETCESYEAYDQAILRWLNVNMNPIATSLLVLSGIQFVALCISFGLIVTEIRQPMERNGANKYEM